MLVDVVKILVDNGATDVCHAAKRQFPDNPMIAKCTELTLGEVVGTGDKPCVIS
jgi:hypothetical protein